MSYPPPAPSEDPCCAGGASPAVDPVSSINTAYPPAPPGPAQVLVVRVTTYPPPPGDEFPCCLIAEYFTTTVYPIESTDDFHVEGRQSKSFYWRTNEDEAQVWADLLDGTFRTVVVTYDIPQEETQVWADMLDGVFRTVVVTYDMGREETQVWADMLDGTFALVVVVYDNWPREETQVWADMLNGTMT